MGSWDELGRLRNRLRPVQQSDGRAEALSKAHAQPDRVSMSWQECTAIPGKSYSAEVGMASAAKRSVIVKKFQTCAIINSTSIVGSGEPTGGRGVPINQPLQWLLSTTNSIDRSLSSLHTCVSHLLT